MDCFGIFLGVPSHMYGTYRQQTAGGGTSILKRSITPELKLYERPNSPQNYIPQNASTSLTPATTAGKSTGMLRY